jgi:hypothetical protein
VYKKVYFIEMLAVEKELTMSNEFFSKNIETIRKHALDFKEAQDPNEKDRLRNAWDDLCGHTLMFVTNTDELKALHAVSRSGNTRLGLRFVEKQNEFIEALC